MKDEGKAVLAAEDDVISWNFHGMKPAIRNDLQDVFNAMDDFIDVNPGFRLTLCVESE
jgi:hypothetical protein